MAGYPVVPRVRNRLLSILHFFLNALLQLSFFFLFLEIKDRLLHNYYISLLSFGFFKCFG